MKKLLLPLWNKLLDFLGITEPPHRAVDCNSCIYLSEVMADYCVYDIEGKIVREFHPKEGWIIFRKLKRIGPLYYTHNKYGRCPYYKEKEKEDVKK